MERSHRRSRAQAACLFLLLCPILLPSCHLFDDSQANTVAGGQAGNAPGKGAGPGGAAGTNGAAGMGGVGGDAGGSSPTSGCISPIECDGITNECTERTCID